MAESTFFANRAVAQVVTGEAESDTSATFAATTTISLVDSGTYAAGDYVYNHTNDEQFNLSRIESFNGGSDTITLEYVYDGTTGSGKSLYKATLDTLAVLKGIEVTTNYEVETLYSMDSIAREDVAKHTTDIEVKVSYAKFDSTPSNDWGMYIINPTSGNGTVEDTNTVFFPYLIVNVLDTDGDYQELLLKEVYFENLPTPMSENDFIVRELTGHASNIKFRSY